MTPDPYMLSLRDYGWTAVLLLFAMREVWPWVRDRVIPQARAERTAETKRKLEQESRQTHAMELIAQATDEIKKQNVLTTERLANLTAALSEHDRYTRESMPDIYRAAGLTPRRRKSDKRQ
jgi:hypothetical protein